MAELALRLFQDDKSQQRDFSPAIFGAPNDRDKSFLVEYDPVFGYRIKNVGTDELFVDSVGREFTRKKKAGTIRIVCLGGSTTYGVGAEPERSYPVLLHQILSQACHAADRSVEVINAGVMGYHSWHSLLRATFELDALEPDFYVIMDAVNDFYASQAIDNVGGLESEKNVLLALVNSQDKGGSAGLSVRLATWCENLASYRLLKKISGRFLGQDTAKVAQRLEKFGYRSNMKRIIEERKQHGIGVLIVDYPWLYNFISPRRHALNFPYKVDKALMAEASRYFHNTNKELCVQYGAAYLDMQSFFNALMDDEPNINRIYTDSVHLSKYANFLLAQSVANALLAQSVFKDRTPPCGVLLESGDPLLKLYAWGRHVGPFGWQPLTRAIPARVAAVEGTKMMHPEDMAGWSFVYPTDSPGVVKLAFRPAEAQKTGSIVRCFFYPRIGRSGAGLVRVTQLHPDSRSRELMVLDASNEEAVPCAQSYCVDVDASDDEVIIQIDLYGESQLWDKDGRYLFQIPPYE